MAQDAIMWHVPSLSCTRPQNCLAQTDVSGQISFVRKLIWNTFYFLHSAFCVLREFSIFQCRPLTRFPAAACVNFRERTRTIWSFYLIRGFRCGHRVNSLRAIDTAASKRINANRLKSALDNLLLIRN